MQIMPCMPFAQCGTFYTVVVLSVKLDAINLLLLNERLQSILSSSFLMSLFKNA